MQDAYWQAAYDAVLKLLHASDLLVAPRGAWPGFPCVTRFYDDAIDTDGATVFMLHKGRLPGIARPAMRYIATEWTKSYSNNVFVIYSAHPKTRLPYVNPRDLFRYPAVDRYINAASYRTLKHRVFYLHLPKAAGTSTWLSLRRAFPANIYYSGAEQMRHNPPGDACDLIGGHFSYADIAGLLAPNDRVIGMVRAPTARFRSAFLHSRRAGEDASIMAPAMKFMRDRPIAEFLASDYGKLEARLQLLMLGAAQDGNFFDEGEAHVFAKATAVIDDARCIFGQSERSGAFLDVVARVFSRRIKRYATGNRADYTRQAADVAEFDGAIELVQRENAQERELYRHAAARFTARYGPPPPATA